MLFQVAQDIQRTDIRPLIILSSSSQQKILYFLTFKRLIEPALPDRYHIEMSPDSKLTGTAAIADADRMPVMVLPRKTVSVRQAAHLAQGLGAVDAIRISALRPPDRRWESRPGSRYPQTFPPGEPPATQPALPVVVLHPSSSRRLLHVIFEIHIVQMSLHYYVVILYYTFHA